MNGDGQMTEWKTGEWGREDGHGEEEEGEGTQGIVCPPTAQGGVQLLSNHRGAEDGKDPAAYPWPLKLG